VSERQGAAHAQKAAKHSNAGHPPRRKGTSMASANSSFTDIITTTLDNRSKKVADNVTKHNAFFHRLQEKGAIKPANGGAQIVQELSFQENGNFQWYSGSDILNVGQTDMLTAANFPWRQAACAVVISGLEEGQNSGEPAVLQLLAERIKVTESTMANNLAQGAYSDGSSYGGKQVAGLGAAILAAPTSGVYGGIDRASYTFWRNYATGSLGAQTVTTIGPNMTKVYLNTKRGADHVDLILADNTLGALFISSLQPNQRFMNPKLAEAGFDNVRFMGADVVVDGGYGGFAPSNVMYFLNTNHIFLRPHPKRNMKSLGKREAFNQDMKADILAWMGNMTVDCMFVHGYFQGS
jgi:hypothetical protein